MSLMESHPLSPQVKERYLYWEERRRRLPLRNRQGRSEAKRHASTYAVELRAAGFNTLPRPGFKYTARRGAAMLAVLGVLGGGAIIGDHSQQAVKGVGASVMQTAEQNDLSLFHFSQLKR